jgi:3-dehydroquinate dehydratase-2
LKRILVIHGPNLNMLGSREPEVYGRTTLAEIDARLAATARARGATLESYQSNSEGDLVTRIQQARGAYDWILLNPAGFTHTSVAIRDAVVAAGVRAIEVHLTNVHKREAFRHDSRVADVVVGRVMGFGDHSYDLALAAALEDWAAP